MLAVDEISEGKQPAPPVEKWVHLSDLHFGTEQAEVCDALRELIAQQKPRGLVISGDVTQRAKAHEFQAASDYLTSVALGLHVLVVPGNHDIPLFRVWERATGPYRMFRRTFGVVDSVRSEDVGHFRFVLVNTTRWFRHKQGTLSRTQVSRVERAIGEAPVDKLRAVVLHHPLPAFDDAGARFRGDFVHFRDSAEAMRRWAQAGLDLVFCGHTHHPRVLRLTEVPRPQGLSANVIGQDQQAGSEARVDSVSVPSTPWLIQAGTSLSHRQRSEPNSLYILSARSRSDASSPERARPLLMIERWDFLGNTQKFERISQRLLN